MEFEHDRLRAIVCALGAADAVNRAVVAIVREDSAEIAGLHLGRAKESIESAQEIAASLPAKDGEA